MVHQELKSFAEKSPEGWEGTVKALKKHGDEVDNPWALAHWMKKKGYKSHKESINEAKFSKDQIEIMRQAYGTLSGMNPSSPTYKKFIKFLDKLPKDQLKQLANAKIKFVSILAKNRLKGESVLGYTTKKGKTIKVRHKKSQKSLVVVDTPAVRKKYAKLGFFPESVEEAKTVSIDGEELMNFLMKRFKYSKKKAIDVMKKHKMDTSFLKNESINEGFTKYHIRLTKTPGWYGVWDKNGKQKFEGDRKYVTKHLKKLKTRMGNVQLKSLIDVATKRKGKNISFDVVESVSEGFGGELKGKDKEKFEKARKENADQLGYKLTGKSDIREAIKFSKEEMKQLHQNGKLEKDGYTYVYKGK